MPVQVGQLLPRPPWTDILVVQHGGGAGPWSSIVCGFLQCDELLFHPILRHLPALLHVGPESRPGESWLAATIRHAAAEATELMPGSRNMLPRLAELMFVEILREHMQDLADDQVGWFAAYRDPVARAALGYLHAAPFEDWSVTELARRVGVSRVSSPRQAGEAEPPCSWSSSPSSTTQALSSSVPAPASSSAATMVAAPLTTRWAGSGAAMSCA